MKTATVTIKGVAPYCASRFHNTPKLEKETGDDHEKRTWRERAHFDEQGVAYIPGKAFKFALATCARKLGIQVPGRGKKTYKDSFASGVLILHNLSLGTAASLLGAMELATKPNRVKALAAAVETAAAKLPTADVLTLFAK